MAGGRVSSGLSVLVTAVVVLALAIAAGVLLLQDRGDGQRKESSHAATKHPATRSSGVRYADLPVEARQTVDRILAGGPFPYAPDGNVFENREALLPTAPSGYYHEYTVRTPGASDRGPRRIVSGKGAQMYYSPDHYRSFRPITGIPKR